jgi:hypothetical protein
VSSIQSRSKAVPALRAAWGRGRMLVWAMAES